MKEKYSVELELLTKNFKDKLNESEKNTKILANKIKEASKSKLDIDTSKFNSSINNIVNVQLSKANDTRKQIESKLSNLRLGKIDSSSAKSSLESLLQDIEWINYEYGQITNKNVSIKIDTQGIETMKNIGVNIDLIKNNIEDATTPMNALNKSTKELDKNVKKVSSDFQEISNKTSKNNLGNIFKEPTNNTKRFLMSLFSLHTAWSGISRISSQVLANDDLLNAKTELISSTMQNALAPAIRLVVDAGQYAIITIAKLIEIFTGYNALANVTTKNLRKTEQASKSMNRALAGIDEITNLKTSSGGLSNGIQSDLEALNDFQDKIKKVNDLFDKFSKTTFGSWIMKAINWFKDLDPAMQAALITGGLLITKFGLPNLFKGLIDGAKSATGSLGGAGVLGALESILALGAISVTIGVIGSIFNNLKQIEESHGKILEINHEYRKSWLESETDINRIYDTMSVNNQAAIDALKQASTPWNTLLGLSDKYLKTGEQVVINSEDIYNKLVKIYEEKKLTGEEQMNLLKKLKEQSEVNDTIIGKLQSEGRETGNLVEINKRYKDKTKEIYDSLVEQGYSYDEIYKKTGLIKDEVEKIYDKANSNPTMNIDVYAKNKIEPGFFDSIGQKIGGAFEWAFSKVGKIGNLFSTLGTFILPKYDVGTNYVPNDQIAVVHQGEAIVPKKYNPIVNQNYINNFNSNEVAYLLREIKDTLEEKEFNAFISEEEIGRTSNKWNESNRRIMGR